MSLKVEAKNNNFEIKYPDNVTVKSLPIVKTLESDSSLKRTGQKISFYIKKFLSGVSFGAIYGSAKNTRLLKHINFDSTNEKQIKYYVIKDINDLEAGFSKLKNHNYDRKDALIKKGERETKLNKYLDGSIRTTSDPTDYHVVVTYDKTLKSGEDLSKANPAIVKESEILLKQTSINAKVDKLNDKISEFNQKVGLKDIKLQNYINSLSLQRLATIKDLDKLTKIENEIDRLSNKLDAIKPHLLESEIRKFLKALDDIPTLPPAIESYQEEKSQLEKKQEALIGKDDKCNFSLFDRCFKGMKKLTEKQRLQDQAKIDRLEAKIGSSSKQISTFESDLAIAKKTVAEFFGEKLNTEIDKLEKTYLTL